MTYLLWIQSQKIKRERESDCDEGDTCTAEDDDVDDIDPFSDDSDSDSDYVCAFSFVNRCCGCVLFYYDILPTHKCVYLGKGGI